MTVKPKRRFGPARVFRLGEEPLDDFTAAMTAEDRLNVVAILSGRMRELTGVPSEPLRRDRVLIRSLNDK